VVAAGRFPDGSRFCRIGSATKAAPAGLTKLQEALDDPIWGEKLMSRQ
jgi:hypothetical protein